MIDVVFDRDQLGFPSGAVLDFQVRPLIRAATSAVEAQLQKCGKRVGLDCQLGSADKRGSVYVNTAESLHVLSLTIEGRTVTVEGNLIALDDSAAIFNLASTLLALVLACVT